MQKCGLGTQLNSTGVDQHLLQVFVIMRIQGSVDTCENQQEGKCYKELYSHEW